MRINLLVIRLPQVCHDRYSLGECFIVKLADRQLKSVLVAADSGQQDAPLLVEVVIGEKF